MSENNERITVVDEEGNETLYEVQFVIEVDDQEYAILAKVGNSEDDMSDVFRLETDEDGEQVLVFIEDDIEFLKVCEAIDELELEELN
jgi:putative Holliday junction resolvase